MRLRNASVALKYNLYIVAQNAYKPQLYYTVIAKKLIAQKLIMEAERFKFKTLHIMAYKSTYIRLQLILHIHTI